MVRKKHTNTLVRAKINYFCWIYQRVKTKIINREKISDFKMKIVIVTLMVMLIIATITTTTVSAEEQDEYIHLPGKNCDDAPECPDNRPCVMAKPRCNAGTCGTAPVPICGRKI
ncbi:uncharacterized protein LOC122854208 [Aphidius gifuensis]|uniref:uncharacterized protein LOC122854208 n=1 Tax=Aphidius gifuensis TaxID=684658 RepID=UPI001CDD03ED|nr:uncharacterized protein LOC122854208 [Aphidius gifuensis]